MTNKKVYEYDENNMKELVFKLDNIFHVRLNHDALQEFLLGLEGLSTEFKIYEDISLRSNALSPTNVIPVSILEIISVKEEDLKTRIFSRYREMPEQVGIRADIYASRSELRAMYQGLRQHAENGFKGSFSVFGSLSIQLVDDSFFVV